MNSDGQLAERVRRELAYDPSVRDDEIAVAAKDGVVTLGGTVESYATKWRAVEAAERVAGVKAVADDMAVVLPGAEVRSDTDIAHAVATALTWNVQVPEERIKARVDNGWVTLDGTVHWEFQKKAAFRAVRDLAGVRGVRNLIAIRAAPVPIDVRARIDAALRRQAELEAEEIEVDVLGSNVTLHGQVHSAIARHLAEQAAWSAPGVSRVQDLLTVREPASAGSRARS
jgi:osmotically-inducible protein OsmY